MRRERVCVYARVCGCAEYLYNLVLLKDFKSIIFIDIIIISWGIVNKEQCNTGVPKRTEKFYINEVLFNFFMVREGHNYGKSRKLDIGEQWRPNRPNRILKTSYSLVFVNTDGKFFTCNLDAGVWTVKTWNCHLFTFESQLSSLTFSKTVNLVKRRLWIIWVWKENGSLVDMIIVLGELRYTQLSNVPYGWHTFIEESMKRFAGRTCFVFSEPYINK